jgi:hypothetical protein
MKASQGKSKSKSRAGKLRQDRHWLLSGIGRNFVVLITAMSAKNKLMAHI